LGLKKGMKISATKVVEVPETVVAQQRKVTGSSPPPPPPRRPMYLSGRHRGRAVPVEVAQAAPAETAKDRKPAALDWTAGSSVAGFFARIASGSEESLAPPGESFCTSLGSCPDDLSKTRSLDRDGRPRFVCYNRMSAGLTVGTSSFLDDVSLFVTGIFASSPRASRIEHGSDPLMN